MWKGAQILYWNPCALICIKYCNNPYQSPNIDWWLLWDFLILSGQTTMDKISRREWIHSVQSFDKEAGHVSLTADFTWLLQYQLIFSPLFTNQWFPVFLSYFSINFLWRNMNQIGIYSSKLRTIQCKFCDQRPSGFQPVCKIVKVNCTLRWYGRVMGTYLYWKTELWSPFLSYDLRFWVMISVFELW